MSLQGQARTAYKKYLDESMSSDSIVEETSTEGIMSRNKSVAQKEELSSLPLIKEFKQLQKLRAGTNNG